MYRSEQVINGLPYVYVGMVDHLSRYYSKCCAMAQGGKIRIRLDYEKDHDGLACSGHSAVYVAEKDLYMYLSEIDNLNSLAAA